MKITTAIVVIALSIIVLAGFVIYGSRDNGDTNKIPPPEAASPIIYYATTPPIPIVTPTPTFRPTLDPRIPTPPSHGPQRCYFPSPDQTPQPYPTCFGSKTWNS